MKTARSVRYTLWMFAVLIHGQTLPHVFCHAADRPTAESPNVVVILVDDMGWSDLSCQGSEYYETPHVDRLASEGIRFTDAYAACAVCSPTRAAVLTGRYPARVGITDWIRARFQRGSTGTPAKNPTQYVGGPRRKLLCPPNPYWMEQDEVTLAEALKPAGYATCHIGKWHLGDDDWYPQQQGFDFNFGGCDYGQPPSYFDPYTNRRLPQGIPTLRPRRSGEYLTDREADEAALFIRQQKDKPFFLYLAHYAVHTPIQAKRDLTARYETKPKTNQKNATYAAMVHSVDQSTGKLLAALDETGVADRTLVIFTSDNGGLLGPTHNAPLRSGKGFPYEGGIRVPLIVRWPEKVAAGSVSDKPVISVDYFPTILQAASLPLPEGRDIDGVSLVEHLESGGDKPLGREAIYWFFPHYRGSVSPYGMVRTGPWKLIKRFETSSFELYHLADDLAERHNLADQMPDRVGELDAMLMTHLDTVGAKLPRPNPDYRPKISNDDRKPSVLILGDSISIGYTPAVREKLKDQAVVVRPMRDAQHAENCAGTNNGVRHIDRWLQLGDGRWDVIHFNFGLHDLKRVHPETGQNSNDPDDPHQAPPERYEKQLTEIVQKLKKTGATLIFATTTPVPRGGVKPFRDTDDPARYNEIARKVMERDGVKVNDLYTFAQPRLATIQQPVNVHFTREGSMALAEQVVKTIKRAFPAPAAQRP